MQLPSGVVTFLMTDIEASTRLWEESPGAMREALARHDSIAASIIGAHAGFLLKSRGEGDSTFSVFARATDAVVAACELQSGLTAEPWPEGAPLRVRVAVHTGEADLGEDDYYGTAVNRCARLRSIAHGGQVLVSESAAGLVRETLPEEVTLRDLGFQRLRDLAEPERVSQLLHPSLPSDFPALRTIDLVPNNLPHQVSAFIGREEEMGRIKELLRGTRLLTLTGAGGVGKTRLALQAAAEMLYEYPDGVWLVELAALSDGELAWQVLATALDLREEPGRRLAETVLGHLTGRQVLLVLDNCEHLLDASATLAEQVTQRGPGVRILATSREGLRAEGEVVWRVPSLSVPHRRPGVDPQPEQLTQYAAVRLFIDRATRANAAFAMTNDNAPAVAEICERLDGIPLAIELAAARGNSLTPQQIEQRLDQRFRLLTGGRRTALPRQQTLEATVDWSYDLLPEAERELFARLSVFAGGFTLAAVEAVCAGDGSGEADVQDLLGELVSKSLVIAGMERYWMLETLRAYGAERLAQEGDAEATHHRHAGFYGGLAEQAKDRLRGAEQAAWLTRLEAERGNLRSALAWLLDHEPGQAAQVAVSVRRLWEVRGPWSEGRELLARVLDAGEELPPDLKADALIAAGSLARFQGDYETARALSGEGLTLGREHRIPRIIAGACTDLGTLAVLQGDYAEARSLHEQARAAHEEAGDVRGLAVALHNIGMVAWHEGDYGAAREAYEQSLARSRSSGDSYVIAITLTNLGIVRSTRSEYAEARACHEESLAIRRALGDQSGIATSLHNLALVAQEQGDNATARALYREAALTHEATGNRPYLASTLHNLGNMAYDEGDYESALAYFERILTIHRALGQRAGIAEALGSIGLVREALGDAPGARDFCEQGLALSREVGDARVVVIAVMHLGSVLQGMGDLRAAAERYLEAGRGALGIGDRICVANSMLGLAQVADADGRYREAVRWHAAADHLRTEIGVPLPALQQPWHDESLARLRAELGDEAFEAAWQQGLAQGAEGLLALDGGPLGDKTEPT